MQTQIREIFRDLEPYRIVSDLGFKISREAGRDFCRGPLEEAKEVQIRAEGFLSVNDGSEFYAGNLFDYLAALFGTYRQAIELVIDNYSNFARNIGGLSLMHNIETFAQELEGVRNDFLKFLKLRANVAERPELFSEAAVWLRGHGFDYNHCWKSVYFAKGEELNTLIKDLALPSQENYAIFPYLLNYHTYSRLHVVPIAETPQRKVILLNRARR
jgi:hypothetical protein